MKKVLGWGAALVVVALILGGLSSDNTKNSPSQNNSTEVQSAVTEQKPVSKPTSSNSAVETAPAPQATPAPQPKEQAVQPKIEEKPNCNPNYTPCVPNVSYDLDCSDISFSVTVIGSDPHRFDRDGDGYGCESN